MKTKRTKKHRPWLSPTGVAISTKELAAITGSWSRQTWDAYLKWYERPLKARLLVPGIFDKIADQQPESIFQQFGQVSTFSGAKLCNGLLESLRPDEAQVLRLIFLEGRTQSEVGAVLGLSQPGIYQIKRRALQRLKRGPHGDKVITCELMRGEESEAEKVEDSVSEASHQHPLKSNRRYRPQDQTQEIRSLQKSSIRSALESLSERARAVIYLHHFCGISISQVARKLSIGVNVAEQIEASGMSKIKRNIIQYQTGQRPGEGVVC